MNWPKEIHEKAIITANHVSFKKMLQLFSNSIIFTFLEFGYSKHWGGQSEEGRWRERRTKEKRKREWGEENEKDNFFGSYIRRCLPVTKSMVNREAASYQLKIFLKLKEDVRMVFNISIYWQRVEAHYWMNRKIDSNGFREEEKRERPYTNTTKPIIWGLDTITTELYFE